ncbi:MAG TPA: hypothetical protein VGH54_29525 [Mycobacterium sp.]|jgi:hypothetical protein|uniref:hypothetical protein n=1 Tax=Mycobacterium sp. TaxID=1785 RepID=UPI002F3E2C07
MASRFYAPAEGPVQIGLTAVTVPHPTREGAWLPGLYWRRDGRDRADSALLMLPGVTVRAADFPAGTRLTVTVEAEKESPDA